jgi:hypothetical protein
MATYNLHRLAVVLAGGFATIVFLAVAIVLFLVLTGGDLYSPTVVLSIFIIVTISTVIVIHLLAEAVLYPHEDANSVQLVGGASAGGLLSAKCATWPFAKMVATGETLRVYTPWKLYELKKSELVSMTRRGLPMVSELDVSYATEKGTETVTFYTGFWRYDILKAGLERLGYTIKN